MDHDTVTLPSQRVSVSVIVPSSIKMRAIRTSVSVPSRRGGSDDCSPGPSTDSQE